MVRHQSVVDHIYFQKIAGHKCSETMVEFLKYARGLNFTDTPDYGYLRGLLQNELAKHQLINDGHFDWMDSSTESKFSASISNRIRVIILEFTNHLQPKSYNRRT